ncbi:MAG: cell division protein FtsA [Rikenellaceae bacterium]|nr:cell division protein FtsA [Rikenellaceae bacterium]
MEKKEYVVAIDLGTSKVVTLVGKKSDNHKIEILSGAVSDSLGGVSRGEIKNTEHLSKALKNTLEKIEKELGISVKEAYVGITGQHIKSSKHSGYIFIENNDNEVRKTDVQRLNESMNNVQIPIGETIVHIIPQKYSVDGESDIGEPVGVIGKKLEASFNIVSGNRETITRIDKCLAKSNIKVSRHILNPLASAEAVLVPDEKELGVAVVDIGGGTTDLCIYHDNIVRHVAIIPLGGNIINRDIRYYGILERYIESLKIKFGGAVSELERPDKYITIPGVNARSSKEISFRNLASIIEARMLDVIESVNYEIRRSGYKDKLAAGIVLTGACANLRNLDILFRGQTGYEVRIAVPDVHVAENNRELINDPGYSTAVGLLLQALKDGVAMVVDAPKTVAVPPVSQSQPSVTANPQQATSQRPKFNVPEKDPVKKSNDTAFDDAEEDGKDDKPRKRGIFGKIADKFAGMFETIDDEI